VRIDADMGTSVPIVFVLGFDPLGVGLVRSLAKPEAIQRIESALGVSIIPAPAQVAQEIPGAIGGVARVGGKGLLNAPDPIWFQERKLIADLCIEHGLAAFFGAVEFTPRPVPLPHMGPTLRRFIVEQRASSIAFFAVQIRLAFASNRQMSTSSS
jgi:hypothetical protein